ncbi:MAG: MATE family efflux transporter [Nitrospinae bacterium]|nr:MATE family efflux transporter [Nitrospinota bacterium]
MKSIKRYDYTKGSIGFGLFRLAVPSCLEPIAWNADILVEIFWVGRLGPEYLAAVSLSFMIIFFFRAVGFGIRIAGSALVAQRIGAKEPEHASHAAAQAILLAGVYYVSISILGYVLSSYLLGLLTSDTNVIRVGVGYLQASFLTIAFVDGIFTVSHMLKSSGEPGKSLIGLGISTLLSITFIPLLVFGIGPFAGFGLPGSAIGIGIGRIIGVLVVLWFLTSGRSRLRIRLVHLKPDLKSMRRIILLGWPAAAQNLLERGALLILLKILALFGPVVLAAWSIGNRLGTFSRLPGFGIQSAVRTMVGQNVGANRPDRALKSVYFAMAGLFVMMCGVTFLLYFFAREIVLIFGMKGEGVDVGVACVRILSIGTLFEAVRRMLAGAFQGAANTKPPMVVEAFVRWGFQIPLAYFAALPLGFEASGVWGAMTISHFTGGICLLVWFLVWSRRRGIGSHAEAGY